MNVNIEGDEIVVRVPISALPTALKFSDYVAGFEEGKDGYPYVTDVNLFAKEVLRMLRDESETGSTILTRAFDEALGNAIDDGCEGIKQIGEDE